LATPSERPPQEPTKELPLLVGISVITAKCCDKAGAVEASVEATSCGVDDATNVVFMLDELAVAAGEGVDSSGNDIISYTQKY
jgi:hypothetical protein